MAIIFTTGTINQPDAGSVGLAMAERIRDDVVAHVAWDLVEEFTAAAGTVRWYVFKCLAAQSGLPSDFHVVMSRTLGNGELRMFVCEDYNPATHVASFFAPSSYFTNYTYDATGRYTTTFTLGVNPSAGNGNDPGYASWAPSGTSTKWWITVDNDGFSVAFNGAANGYMHVGAYTSLTTLEILLPIQTTGSNYVGNQSAADTGGITRNPAIASLTYAGAGLTFFSARWLGFPGTWQYNDKLQNNQRPSGELGIAISRRTAGDEAICGVVLGKQKRMRGTDGTIPGAVAFGDAYVMSGRLWVPYLPSASRVWDTGVASS